jgi:hypothetical protein
MEIQKLKFLALIMVWFSCSNDSDVLQDKYQPINPGKKSSSFAIDSNIISFAVPYLVNTEVYEYLPFSYEDCECFSSHYWTIKLIMKKGIDVTKLDPLVIVLLKI